MILFKTHSEFEQQNVAPPDASSEGVGAFAEPVRNRMVLPIADTPDRLYGLIVHELTHQFEFDIIPQSLIRRSVPLWVNEGLSDYERGQWTPTDLMTVRDAAVADIVPKMSEMEGYGNTSNPRLVYNLGHVTIGSRVTVSLLAHVCAGTHDHTRPDMPLRKVPIRIEEWR
jgi:hypothetical protein